MFETALSRISLPNEVLCRILQFAIPIEISRISKKFRQVYQVKLYKNIKITRRVSAVTLLKLLRTVATRPYLADSVQKITFAVSKNDFPQGAASSHIHDQFSESEFERLYDAARPWQEGAIKRLQKGKGYPDGAYEWELLVGVTQDNARRGERGEILALIILLCSKNLTALSLKADGFRILTRDSPFALAEFAVLPHIMHFGGNVKEITLSVDALRPCLSMECLTESFNDDIESVQITGRETLLPRPRAMPPRKPLKSEFVECLAQELGRLKRLHTIILPVEDDEFEYMRWASANLDIAGGVNRPQLHFVSVHTGLSVGTRT